MVGTCSEAFSLLNHLTLEILPHKNRQLFFQLKTKEILLEQNQIFLSLPGLQLLEKQENIFFAGYWVVILRKTLNHFVKH